MITMNIVIDLVKIHHDVTTPVYAKPGDSGADICAYLEQEMVRIMPQQSMVVPTGLKVAVPRGFEIQVRPRSGLASRGLCVANSPGTIDSGYRGELKVLLLNTSDFPHQIFHGQKIAQIVVAPVLTASFREVEDLEETERGVGGFGSTGD